MKRTDKERFRQIEGINNMRNNIPEFSHFGDPNYERFFAKL